jgi:hypothetical protein
MDTSRQPTACRRCAHDARTNGGHRLTQQDDMNRTTVITVGSIIIACLIHKSTLTPSGLTKALLGRARARALTPAQRAKLPDYVHKASNRDRSRDWRAAHWTAAGASRPKEVISGERVAMTDWLFSFQAAAAVRAASAVAAADWSTGRALVLHTLAKVEAIGRRAVGRGASSDTSRIEAGLAARARVLRAFRTEADGARLCARWLFDAAAWRRVEVVAIRAARASLRGDEFCGMAHSTGAALRPVDSESPAARLAWAMLPALESYQFGRPVGRGFGPALTLARACRRLAAARLADLGRVHNEAWAGKPPGAAARAWGRTLSAFTLRQRRVSRVLILIGLGESLEYACQRAGFAWDAAEGRSHAFARAYDETGLRAGLERDAAPVRLMV